MSRFFDFLLARPRSSLLAAVMLMVVAALGMLNLEIDFSPEQVYVGQDNAVEFCEQHKKLFRFEDSLVLVILESTDGESLLREDCLNWLKSFADQSRTLPGVRDVTSLVTLERPRVRNEISWAPILLEEYYSDSEYVQSQLARLPLLNDLLVSEDQRLMMTLIDLDPDQRKIKLATERVRSIEDTIASIPLPEGAQTFITGVPAIRVDVIDSIVKDQFQMVPICSVMFLIVSLLMFRSPTVTILSLLSALMSVALTLGMMGYAGFTFSVMSNMIPPLLLIIGAANNVHILSRFQVEVQQTNADLLTCAKVTMMEMSKTCLLTLTTTGIGFGSLLIARAELLQSLAIQAAAGMACCYIGLMVVMPPTLAICGPMLAKRIRGTATGDDASLNVSRENVPSRLGGFWAVTGRLISRYSGLIVLCHVLLAAWTLWACRDIAINSYMFETYDEDHPTMQAVRKMDERMSGLISLEVQLRAENRERLFETDVVAALAKLRNKIPQDDRVSFYRDYVEVLSVFDYGRTLNSDLEVVEASLRRVKLALRQLDKPEITSAFLSNSQPVARVMMRIQDVGSAGMKDLIADVEQSLAAEMPGDVKFQVTGDAYLHAVCMDAFTRDLFYSLIAASGVIFLLITVLFKSLRIGLISAIPNMFPLVMTLGYMHLKGYELTSGNVIVFAISLGIAVDDTIHFLARYRDEKKVSNSHAAIQGTLRSSGRAILLTSILVVSGLSILVFSDFVPTRRFAELTAITMCSALPGDIILLPAMLWYFGAGKTEDETDCQPTTN